MDTEREYVLTARGDIAIISLRAMLNALKPVLETNRLTAERLNEVQAKQPVSDKPTLLSIVAQVSSQNVQVLSDVVTTTQNCLDEIDFLSGRTGVDNDPDTALTNLINAIRASSTVHATKTDEEIKKMLGL